MMGSGFKNLLSTPGRIKEKMAKGLKALALLALVMRLGKTHLMQPMLLERQVIERRHPGKISLAVQ